MAIPDESLTHETGQRLALITSRFPDRFDETQIEQIRKRIERSIRLGQTMRSVALTNGDGPELIMTTLPMKTIAE